MSLVEIRTDSGLVTLQESGDESQIRRALKQIDPLLRLVPQHSDYFGGIVYKVYIDRGDRPAEFLCGWWNDSMTEAYPLSSALVDMVRKLNLNERGRYPDPDAELARVQAERLKDYRSEVDEIVKMYGRRMSGKSYAPLKRSPGLVAARRRVRRRTTEPELKP